MTVFFFQCAGRGNKMRRSKQRMPTVEPEEEDVEENADESDGFFACYLLCSLCPRFKGHTYIGFTVNPRRRIRQHNGEIRCGAWRTKSKRPWEMVLCIHGFPSKVSALQFEWAWQHPRESKAVRDALSGFKSLSGLANKIKLAFTMLSLPQWDRFNLSLNFFSTKYAAHSAHCPRLPKHMRTTVLPMAELPCYSGIPNLDDEDDDDDDDDGDELDHVLEEREAHPSDPISLCHPKDVESDEEAMRMQIHDHGYDPDEEHDHIHEPISQNHPMIAESDEELDDKQKKDYDHDHDHNHDLEEREEQIDVCLSLSRPKSKLGPRGASLLDVIDLSTPPSCRRGRSSICVEVIDLTGSPA